MAKVAHKAKLVEAARRGPVRSTTVPASIWEATTDAVMVAAQADKSGMVLTFARPDGQRFIERR